MDMRMKRKILNTGPLVGLEDAIGIQGFGWYTKESLFRQLEILIDNVKAMSEGRPTNVVNNIKT